ncbi:MAG: hypothetical protein ACREYE_05735 [Gammaproteobacteria bacterium]
MTTGNKAFSRVVIDAQLSEHHDPRELLDELAAIEVEIVEEIEALRDVMNMTTVRPGVSKGE